MADSDGRSVTVWLPNEVLTELDAYAAAEERSRSWVVNKAIQRYLREEKNRREQSKQTEEESHPRPGR
ncbi:MAG: ribbon-helix-helix domain-containing protein [Candidatus Promineofilum sp.]|nr:ribbon-helix-helix domain-containing protein [Promineifilum sp.]